MFFAIDLCLTWSFPSLCRYLYIATVPCNLQSMSEGGQNTCEQGADIRNSRTRRKLGETGKQRTAEPQEKSILTWTKSGIDEVFTPWL